MPQAQSDVASALAWLQQQGYVPRGNNLALVPFSNPNNASNGSDVTGSAPPSPVTAGNVASSADGPKNDGTDPIPNEDGTFTDPRTGEKVSADDALSIWPWLAAAGAGAGAYALTRALSNNKADQLATETGKGGGLVAQGRPVVDGGKLYPQPRDPLAPLSETQAAIAERKALPAPSKKNTKPSTITAEQSRIALPDTRADVTPEELAKAKAITQQLIANRTKGNAQFAKQGNLKRRYNLPTGSTDEEGLLNTVIKLMRMVK